MHLPEIELLLRPGNHVDQPSDVGEVFEEQLPDPAVLNLPAIIFFFPMVRVGREGGRNGRERGKEGRRDGGKKDVVGGEPAANESKETSLISSPRSLQGVERVLRRG